MTWRLSLVPTDGVKALWPTVAPMLARAVRYSGGRFGVRDVFEDLQEAKQVLWVAYDDTDRVIAAALTTRIAAYARRSALVVECAGGGRMRDWLQLASVTLRAYARDAGLSGVEVFGRTGWMRALKSCGWQQKLVLMEIDAALPDEVV